MASRNPPVLVVGGGVIGVCCAYYLAKRGTEVTLLERDELASGASHGNAGCIALGHPPLPKPGRIKQALRSLLDPVSPLYVAPRWDPELVRWLWAFRAYCTTDHVRRSMDVLGPLGHETGRLFEQILEEEHLECDFRRDGYYEVYLTDRALAAARGEGDMVASYGYHVEVLSGSSMREREPTLTSAVRGGIFYRDSASLSPHRFVLGLADAAERAGVTVRTQAPVSEVVLRNGRAESVRLGNGETVRGRAVVLTTGAYSLALTRRLGLRLPLQAAKGYHRDRATGSRGTPPVRHTLMFGEASVFCTPLADVVRFAGTLEFSGVNHEMRRPRLEQLTNAADRYLEGMAGADSVSEWCGLRPCLPDGLPAIGPVPGAEEVFLASGHAMLGLTLAPVTGKLIAEYVLDGSPSMKVAALAVDRF